MSHLAIWEGNSNGSVPETTWGEHVIGEYPTEWGEPLG